MAGKKVIAVVFGGRSVEHDVSILTGLQFLEALDPGKYEGLPVYVDPLGQWWTGAALSKRSRYPVEGNIHKDLTQLHLDLAAPAVGRPQFLSFQKGIMGENANTYLLILLFQLFTGPMEKMELCRAFLILLAFHMQVAVHLALLQQ